MVTKSARKSGRKIRRRRVSRKSKTVRKTSRRTPRKTSRRTPRKTSRRTPRKTSRRTPRRTVRRTLRKRKNRKQRGGGKLEDKKVTRCYFDDKESSLNSPPKIITKKKVFSKKKLSCKCIDKNNGNQGWKCDNVKKIQSSSSHWERNPSSSIWRRQNNQSRYPNRRWR